MHSLQFTNPINNTLKKVQKQFSTIFFSSEFELGTQAEELIYILFVYFFATFCNSCMLLTIKEEILARYYYA